MRTEIIILMMRCINGEIPCIDDRDVHKITSVGSLSLENPEYREATRMLDNNPLFEGVYKTINDTFWNTWRYIGPKHDKQSVTLNYAGNSGEARSHQDT